MKVWNVTSVEAETSAEVGAVAGEVRRRHVGEAVSSSDTLQSNLCRSAPENERAAKLVSSS